MKRISLIFLLLAGFGYCVSAQSIPESIKTIKLASELARYGYQNRSSLALIESANLFLTAIAEEILPENAEKGAGETTATTNAVSFEPQKLFESAALFAEGDQTLLDLIQKVQSADFTRGAVDGASAICDRVLGGATNQYSVKFYGGESVTVIVAGDGNTDLDLQIFDSNGTLIGSDAGNSSESIITWLPNKTETFTIKVVNKGKIQNDYIIGSN
jgi:hypothetical protein